MDNALDIFATAAERRMIITDCEIIESLEHRKKSYNKIMKKLLTNKQWCGII